MARRKGAAKSKTNARKIALQSDNSQTVKDTHQLKDDPGGGCNAGGSTIKNHKVRPIPHHKMLNLDQSIEIVPIMKSSVQERIQSNDNSYQQNVQNLAHNANTYNNNTNNKSSDLKYLHKKFKRIASATIDDDAIPLVENNLVKNLSVKTLNQLTSTNQPVVSINGHLLLENEHGPLTHGDANFNFQATPSVSPYRGLYTYEARPTTINRSSDSDINLTCDLSRKKLSANVLCDREQKNNHINNNNINISLSPTRTVSVSPINLLTNHQRAAAKQQHQSRFHTGATTFKQYPQEFYTNQIEHPDSTKKCVQTNVNISNDELVMTITANMKNNASNAPGRHVCPFCQLNCTKPSVLRKHIRAHTNERPYPCGPCGFAFKTRSNLYKHYRSRAHALRQQNSTLTQNDTQFDFDEISQGAGSDHDLSSGSTTTSSDVISRPTSPTDGRTSTSPSSGYLTYNSLLAQSQAPISATQNQEQSATVLDKPYKPKFHKAALYHSNSNSGPEVNPIQNINNGNHNRDNPYYANQTELRYSNNSSSPGTMQGNSALAHHPLSTQNVEYLKEHISKIISQNEAIMEGVEPALQKKYHKITGISRGNSFSGSNAGDNTSSTTSAVISSPSSNKQHQNRDEIIPKITKSEICVENNPIVTTQTITVKKLPTLQQQAEQVLKSVKSTDKYQSKAPISLPQQPLNLTSDSSNENIRKRSQANINSVSSSTVTITSGASICVTQPLQIELGTITPTTAHQNHHPQNPERSIIKSLLLNSRGLAVPTTGEGEDAVYTCPLCKISFRSADNLQYHTKCYCQGTPPVSSQNHSNPHSAPISPVGSPSHKYFRSNSFNLCLPEKYSPNTLAKLASSSLRHPHRTPLSLAKLAAQQTVSGHFLSSVSTAAVLATSMAISTTTTGRNRPENIIINTNTCPAPTPLTNTSSMQSVSSQCVQITKQLIDASLPSPGPLLGRTRLVDSYSSESRKSEDAIISNLSVGSTISMASKTDTTIPSTSVTEPVISSIINKRQNTGSYVSNQSSTICYSPAPSTPNESVLSPKNIRLLQMCGGEAKIIARKEEFGPRFGSSGGSIISISPSPDSLPEPSPLGIRSGLFSGGSIIETPKKTSSSSSIASSLSPPAPTPDHSTPRSALQMLNPSPVHLNYFQFPAINSITAYNPLTLPPPSQTQLNALPKQIMHGGKIIPFVAGMPGPDSLSISAAPTCLSPPMHLSPFRKEYEAAIMNANSNLKKMMPSSPVAVRALSHQNPLSLLSPTGSLAKGSARISPKIKPVPLSRIVVPTTSNFINEMDEKQHNAKLSFSDVLNGNNQKSTFTIGNNSQPMIWSPAMLSKKSHDSNNKTFNFTRIADNLSPSKPNTFTAHATSSLTSTDSESRAINFEVIIRKPDIIMKNKKPRIHSDVISPLHIDVTTSSSASSSPVIPTLILPESTVTQDAIVTIAEQRNFDTLLKTVPKATKFLRPSSLPLKPGTFTPKRHHGITPTANTLPLISPETPRPSKNCIQLYLDGHAYTYLGLKCSTKPFYCTVNRPQPVHFTNQHKLSIYSNWQTCAESNPHPLGLSPKEAMSLYDSRQRQQQYRRNGKYTVANSTTKFTTLHSQSLICTPIDVRNKKDSTISLDSLNQSNSYSTSVDTCVEEDETVRNADKIEDDGIKPNASENCSSSTTSSASSLSIPIPIVPGGYESNEDYTYVRGRGRGRYVCSECGIRCKKPSMLKKHIRTHTDVRPYTCQHCSFSFKTKGNLTKHMKSKAHYKKCVELGLNPLPSAIDEDYNPEDEDSSMTSSCGERTSNLADGEDDSDTDDMSDGDDAENESSDTDDAKLHLPEREAAHSLLSLSQTPNNCQNLSQSPIMLIPGQPMTYPYIGSDHIKYQLQSPVDSLGNNNLQLRITKRPVDFISPPPSSSSLFDPMIFKTGDIHHLSEIESSGNNMQPIDLTKPRINHSIEEKKPKFKIAAPVAQTAPTYAGTAGILNSLMSNSEKVPPSLASPLTPGAGSFPLVAMTEVGLTSNSNLANDVFMQTYLTESALQKSKMKQSQMNSCEKRIETPTMHERKVEQVTNNNSSFDKLSVRVSKPLDKCKQSKSCDSKFIEHRNQRHSLDDDHPINKRSKQRKISMPQMNAVDSHVNALKQNKFDVKPILPPSSIVSDVDTAPKMHLSTNLSSLTGPENDKESLETCNVTAVTTAPKITATQTSETIFRIELSPVPESVNDQSGMDTLAEIAAISVKLDTTRSKSPASPLKTSPISSVVTKQSIPNEKNTSPIEAALPVIVNVNSGKENSAKNVASEYLKMTSAEYLKAHQLTNENSDRDETSDKLFIPNITDDSCGSSDPDLTENNPKKFSGPSMVSLTSERVSPAAATMISARTVVVGEDGFKSKSSMSSDLPVVSFPRGSTSNSAARANAAFIHEDGGRSVCAICSKTFLKKHQMVLHMNIHYMNPRKFRCEPCGVNFRSQGHLQKHERSEAHKTKVIQTTTFGQATTRNPRPFECSDCKIAFRIHGHLAKHLRSKTHVQKLECLQKLPFGTYAEIERAGISLTDIDTTDCDNSLASLKILAQKLLLYKEPADKSNIPPTTCIQNDGSRERTESNSEDGEPIGSPIYSSQTDLAMTNHRLNFEKENPIDAMQKIKEQLRSPDKEENAELTCSVSKRRKLNDENEIASDAIYSENVAS